MEWRNATPAGLRRQAQHFAAAGCILCSPLASRTIRGMNESRTDRRQSATERQARSRRGVATRLASIEQQTVEIREQLAALTQLLGIELRQVPPEQRPR